MTASPNRRFAEMTTEEVARLDPSRTVAVLPVAAIEQHGPHLPLNVDAAINQGILDLALDLLPADLPVTVLPACEIGRSEEHLAFPGTLSIRPDTLARVWVDIGESLHHAGLRKLVLFNSHGGQPQVMDLAARELRVRLDMFVVMASWYDLGLPPLPFDATELAHGIHGGAVETSMMLHLRPDLVRRERFRDFRALYLDREGEAPGLLGPHGPAAFAWATQDLHPSGAVGDPRAANAEAGAALVDHAARQVVTLLREVSAFPLDRLRAGP